MKLPLWAALILAAAGGVLFNDAFPAMSWWPLVFPGLMLLLFAQQGRGAWSAMLVGFTGALAFYITDIYWTALYLGPIPWLALSITESFFWSLAAILITLAYRWVPRAIPGRLGTLVALPLIVAGLWTLRELQTDHWPFTGFAWGRVAYTQSQSPFTPLVAWVGVAGVTFLLVWVSAFALACIQAVRMSRLTRAVLPVTAALALASAPLWPSNAHGTARVAAVQGNGPAGYFDPDNTYGAVEQTQINTSRKLFDKGPFDMVVWPEGSADANPLADEQSASILSALSSILDAPLVVGAITEDGSKTFNSSLLWDPDGKQAQYDKQLPVPFGEYIPYRPVFHAIAPALVDLVQRDYTPGTRPNVFDIRSAAQQVKAGISICFDIIDDRQIPQMIDGGAQLILAQTNNADFGRTEENVQQLAIARMRAVQADRSVVNISTVGTSQIIGPDGRTITSTPAYKPGVMVADVPLSTGTTPGVRFASAIELGAATLGGAGLIGCLVLVLADGRGRTQKRRPGGSPDDGVSVFD